MFVPNTSAQSNLEVELFDTSVSVCRVVYENAIKKYADGLEKYKFLIQRKEDDLNLFELSRIIHFAFDQPDKLNAYA